MRHEIDWKNPILRDSIIAGRETLKRKSLRPLIYSVAALLGIFGGISAMFIGLVFVIVHGVLSGDIVFNRAGTVLLIVAIPMLLIGSVFADATERKND